MPEVDRTETGVWKMIAWALDIIVFPLVFGLGYWVWGTQQAVTILESHNTQIADNIGKVEVKLETEFLKLQTHLMNEAASDQQMIYVQRTIEKNSASLESMSEKMTNLLLMQRDLLNEIRSNQNRNYPSDPQ